MGRGTVLVVDDNEAIRDALVELLEGEGYRAVPASSGKEALALLTRMPASLILLDLMMPEMSGVEFFARKEEVAALSSIPVVVLTANHRPRELFDMQVAAWLEKPLDISELFSLVERYAG